MTVPPEVADDLTCKIRAAIAEVSAFVPSLATTRVMLEAAAPLIAAAERDRIRQQLGTDDFGAKLLSILDEDARRDSRASAGTGAAGYGWRR